MEYLSCAEISGFRFHVNGRIDEGKNVISLCCENIPNVPAVAFQDTPEKTLEAFCGMRTMTFAEGLQGVIGSHTNGCRNCSNFCKGDHAYSPLITYVNLSMYPAPCQCRCIYCGAEKKWRNAPEVTEAYERLFSTLEYAKESGIIAKNAVWQVSTGEITIHPYRKRILELVSGECTTFYTNCFNYDEDIAQNLHVNPESAINLSIDAGTADTWRKVKGFDNFDVVTDNLVKYYSQSARAGQITLKYIILPGINDTLEDFLSLVEIMKVLKVPGLSISRDARFKYQMSNDDYIKLTGAAAYLVACCHKNSIKFGLINYTQEESKEIVRLATEILKSGQI